MLTVVLTLISCNRKTVYNHFEHTAIDGWGWEQTDTLYYKVTGIGKGGVFAEEIGLRSISSYPFTELVLIVRQRAVPSGYSRNDTLRISITDKKGHFLGDGLSYHQLRKELPDITLQDDDSLYVTINHFMKRDNLKGIGDVGFKLIRK
jgi:gliding motility-associated lipoprotein GldH